MAHRWTRVGRKSEVASAEVANAEVANAEVANAEVANPNGFTALYLFSLPLNPFLP